MSLNKDIKTSSNRSFGVLFFIVFFIIALWPLKSQGDLRLWSFILSIALWILILERYYFLFKICPLRINKIVEQWQDRQDHSSWYDLKIKDGLVSEISTDLKHNLIPIQTLTGIRFLYCL